MKKKPAERSQAAIIFPQITENANKSAPSVIFQKIHKLSQDVRKPLCVRKQYAKIKYFYLLLSSVSKFEYYRNEKSKLSRFR